MGVCCVFLSPNSAFSYVISVLHIRFICANENFLLTYLLTYCCIIGLRWVIWWNCTTWPVCVCVCKELLVCLLSSRHPVNYTWVMWLIVNTWHWYTRTACYTSLSRSLSHAALIIVVNCQCKRSELCETVVWNSCLWGVNTVAVCLSCQSMSRGPSTSFHTAASNSPRQRWSTQNT